MQHYFLLSQYTNSTYYFVLFGVVTKVLYFVLNGTNCRTLCRNFIITCHVRTSNVVQNKCLACFFVCNIYIAE